MLEVRRNITAKSQNGSATLEAPCGSRYDVVPFAVPSIAHPLQDRLVADFVRPHVFEASFDAFFEAAELLRSMEPSLGASSLQMLTDALFSWKTGVASRVRISRRAVAGRFLEARLKGSVAPGQSYDMVSRRNPLALLSALRKRKGLERQLDKGSRAALEAKQKKAYVLNC